MRHVWTRAWRRALQMAGIEDEPEVHQEERNLRWPAGTVFCCPFCGEEAATAAVDIYGDMKSKDSGQFLFPPERVPTPYSAFAECQACGGSWGRELPTGRVELFTREGWK